MYLGFTENEETYRHFEANLQAYGIGWLEEKLIEEMAELTQAILKRRYMWFYGTVEDLEKARKNVVEELADAKIMIAQIEQDYLNEEIITRDELDATITAKLNRQADRLKGE